MKMPILTTLFLYILLSITPIFVAFPKNDAQYADDISDHRPQMSDVTTDTTTLKARNATEGLISSVWHRISNIFTSENSTPKPEETQEDKHEVLMPNDRVSTGGRTFRMAPEDFSQRNADDGSPPWQRDLQVDENLYPNHQLRMSRSRNKRNSDQVAVDSEEVRWRDISKNYNDTLNKIERLRNNGENKPPPIIIEEFDQGKMKGRRIKRFNPQNTDWQTEKIVEGSDPVENIDKENYIEETNDEDFPFHYFSFGPIIVKDILSSDSSTSFKQELPPLQIIDF